MLIQVIKCSESIDHNSHNEPNAKPRWMDGTFISHNSTVTVLWIHSTVTVLCIHFDATLLKDKQKRHNAWLLPKQTFSVCINLCR